MRIPLPKLLLCIAGFSAIAYGLNYWLTPEIVGLSELKVRHRPRCNASFESSVWQDARSITNGKRYAMLDDLMRRKMLDGKTEAEVRRILGDPLASQRTGNESFVYYTLAPQELFPARSWMFPEWFVAFDNWNLALTFSNEVLVAAVVEQ